MYEIMYTVCGNVIFFGENFEILILLYLLSSYYWKILKKEKKLVCQVQCCIS